MPQRITIQVLTDMLGKMDIRHADEVHYLFVNNYIDFSNYRFREEWFTESYITDYNEAFSNGYDLRELNGYIIEALEEWKQDAPYKYRKAKGDLVFWINDTIPAFEPSMGKEITAAYETAVKSDDAETAWQSLMPFPIRIARQITAKDYEGAAANIYCIFEQFGKAYKDHNKWFEGVPDKPGFVTIPRIVCMQDAIRDLYCHLRQLPTLPKELAIEKDIHLSILNKKNGMFLGDPYFESQSADMYCGHNKQYNDYSDLNQCAMWGWYTDRMK